MNINEATVLLAFVVGFILGIIFYKIIQNKRLEQERRDILERNNYYKSPAYHRKISKSKQWDS